MIDVGGRGGDDVAFGDLLLDDQERGLGFVAVREIREDCYGPERDDGGGAEDPPSAAEGDAPGPGYELAEV